MVNLKEHKNLKVFSAFGFEYKGDSGANQVYGVCPLCGSYSSKIDAVKPSFYINPENKKWDCKICYPQGGGYQTYLKEIYDSALKATTDKDLLRLSAKKTGVKVKTLKDFEVVYSPRINQFLIPVWDMEKKELYNLRRYSTKSNILKNAPGCKAILYNLWQLPKDHLTIWLCEGEWDAMIMHQIIQELKLDRTAVISAPGAGVFNANWQHYFRGKIVHVIYDNDHDTVKNGRLVIGAGKAGQKKVESILGSTPKQLDYINWLSNHDSGFDLRDLYNLRKGNSEKIMKTVVSLLKPNPMPIIAPEGYEDQVAQHEGKPKVEFTGSGLHYLEAYQGYRKWLHLDDIHCIDVLFGSVIANRFPGDPVWLFLVASSGGTKSELIMSLDESPLIYSLSSLTPNTLVSGSPGSGGGDPSLIPKLDQMVLAMKDFTVMLDMNQQARDAIVSQLRDAYDGTCAKGFGTGQERHYKSKFGLVAGVTPNIEAYLEGGSAMGERFLSFYLKEDNTYEGNKLIMRKALSNLISGKKDAMRDELKAVAHEVLNFDFGTQPELPDELHEQIFAISQWTSIMRGTVPRDKYTKEVTRKALIEKPTRLVTQFAKLTLGIAAFRYKTSVEKDEIDLVSRTALSTVPNHLNNVVSTICKTNMHGKFTEEQMAKKIRLPVQAVKKYLEDLYQLGVLETVKYNALTKDYYLSKDAKTLIELGNLYERKTKWEQSNSNRSKTKKKILLKKKS